nr:multicopper oxidase abr1 [Quercus suber]
MVWIANDFTGNGEDVDRHDGHHSGSPRSCAKRAMEAGGKLLKAHHLDRREGASGVALKPPKFASAGLGCTFVAALGSEGWIFGDLPDRREQASVCSDTAVHIANTAKRKCHHIRTGDWPGPATEVWTSLPRRAAPCAFVASPTSGLAKWSWLRIGRCQISRCSCLIRSSSSPNQITRQPHFPSTIPHGSSTIVPPCGRSESCDSNSHPRRVLFSRVSAFASGAPSRPATLESRSAPRHSERVGTNSRQVFVEPLRAKSWPLRYPRDLSIRTFPRRPGNLLAQSFLTRSAQHLPNLSPFSRLLILLPDLEPRSIAPSHEEQPVKGLVWTLSGTCSRATVLSAIMTVKFARLVAAVAACFYGSGLAANVHSLDWNISWVTANPDGLADRPTMAINGQWPLPLLNFTLGDRVIVNLYNGVRVHNLNTSCPGHTDVLQ